MDKYKIIALFGESGSGKDTLQNKILEWYPHFNKMISITTRPQREGEVEGEDYYFTDATTFAEKLLNGDLLEATSFNDWFYGTDIHQLDNSTINIGVLNPKGIQCLMEDSRLEVIPIHVQASDKIRLLRALNRETDPDCQEICRRYFTDRDDFATDITFSHYFVFNEKPEDIETIREWLSRQDWIN